MTKFTEYTLDIIEKLVKIPSYTGNGEAMDRCFEICKEIFKDLPRHVESIDKNAVKNIPGNAISNVDKVSNDPNLLTSVELAEKHKSEEFKGELSAKAIKNEAEIFEYMNTLVVLTELSAKILDIVGKIDVKNFSKPEHIGDNIVDKIIDGITSSNITPKTIEAIGKFNFSKDNEGKFAENGSGEKTENIRNINHINALVAEIVVKISRTPINYKVESVTARDNKTLSLHNSIKSSLISLISLLNHRSISGGLDFTTQTPQDISVNSDFKKISTAGGGLHILEAQKNSYKSMLFFNEYESDEVENSKKLNFDVLSLCHLDTVEATSYDLHRDANMIRGRGVFDMKSFAVAALVNLRYLLNSNSKLKYGVLLTSDEETGGENGTKYWLEEFGLETTVLLDSDNGGNLNSLVEENLGATTIKINGTQDAIKQTIANIKNNFSGFYCEDFNDEMDIIFPSMPLEQTLENCRAKGATFDFLMLRKYHRNNVEDVYHKLYKAAAQISEVTLKPTSVSSGNDASYFFDKSASIITHQATGGGSHGPEEWLNFDSFETFVEIQRNFLLSLASLADLESRLGEKIKN